MESTEINDTELQSLRRQLEIHKQNLFKLQEQAARHGMDVPLSLSNEIDHAQEQIRVIEQCIVELTEARLPEIIPTVACADLDAICDKQVMIALRDCWFNADQYIPRNKMEGRFEDFMTQTTRNAFPVIGGSGLGKTYLLCHLASQRVVSGHPTLLFVPAHFGEGRYGNLAEALSDTLIGEILPADVLVSSLESLVRELQVGGEHLVIFIDAINEFQQPEVVVEELNDLLRSLVSCPQIRFCFTCRTETWKQLWWPLQGRGAISPGCYYGFTQDINLRDGVGEANEIGKYSDKELRIAYQRANLRPELEKLAPRTWELLKDPFILYLVSRTYGNDEIDPELWSSKVMDDYLYWLRQKPDWTPDVGQLLDDMIDKMRDEHIGFLTTADLRRLGVEPGQPHYAYDKLKDFRLIVEDRGRSRRARAVHIYHDRLLEFLLYRRIEEEIEPGRPGVIVGYIIELLEESREFPFLWGALYFYFTSQWLHGNSLSKTDWQVLRQIAVSEAPEAQGFLLHLCQSASTECPKQIEDLLARLSTDKKSEACRKLAVLVAYEQRNTAIFANAIYDPSEAIQVLAAEYLSLMYAFAPETVFKVLSSVREKIGVGLLSLVFDRGEIQTLLHLTLPLALKHFEDPTLTQGLVDLWRDILRDIAVQARTMQALLYAVRSITSRIMKEQDEVGHISLRELEAFYEFELEKRQQVACLAPYLSHERSLDQEGQALLWTVAQQPNGVFMTINKLVVAAQSLLHWEGAIPWISRLLAEGNEYARMSVMGGLHLAFYHRPWIDQSKADFCTEQIFKYFNSPPYGRLILGDHEPHKPTAWYLAFFQGRAPQGDVEKLVTYINGIFASGDEVAIRSTERCFTMLPLNVDIGFVLQTIRQVWQDCDPEDQEVVEGVLTRSLATVRSVFPKAVNTFLRELEEVEGTEGKKLATRVRQQPVTLQARDFLNTSMEALTVAIIARFPALRQRLLQETLMQKCVLCKDLSEAVAVLSQAIASLV